MYQSGNEVANKGGCSYVGARGMWEISVSSFQFCCKPKTALKNTVLKNNNFAT